MSGEYKCVLNIKKLHDKNAILIAARHNKREELQIQPGRIDARRSSLNMIIRGPDNARAVDDLAKRLLANSKTPSPRVSAVKAIEFVFSLPNGTPVDINAFFEACAAWLAGRFGGVENILSADIHLDESNPHMHAVLLPLLDGRMRGSDMLGRKVFAGHQQSFYDEVCAPYGIERPRGLLKGPQKEAAVQQVLRLLQDNPAETLVQCWRAIQAAVMSRPDDWAEDLGIKINGKSLEQLALSSGSGPKTHAAAAASDRRMLERAGSLTPQNPSRKPLPSPIGKGVEAASLSCEGSSQESSVKRQQQASPLGMGKDDGIATVTLRESEIPSNQAPAFHRRQRKGASVGMDGAEPRGFRRPGRVGGSMSDWRYDTPMHERVYLGTMPGEAAEVRRLGAWFDPDLKKWWCIKQLILVTPDLRKWVPPETARMHGLLPPTKQQLRQQRKQQLPQQRKLRLPLRPFSPPEDVSFRPVRPPASGLPACSCLVPPWEDCTHTLLPD
jgi:hypothetical protein